jgi:diguanylate cyclase (GGDEF)-like protein
LLYHVIIGSTALVGILLFCIFLNKDLDKVLINDYLTPAIPLVILICLSIITGLDQIKTGQITAFIINLLVCGVVVLLPVRISFFLYSIPFTVFIVGLFTYQQDIATRNSHLINGGIFWVAVLFLSKFLYDNHVSHLIKNIKLEVANQKLLELSLRDPLTGLSNRRHFEEQIEHELSRIRRFDEQSWLILADIDHFKDINDRYGHATGDHVIKEVASLLQKNIRDVDLACRWGGEEYLLLITRVSLDEALIIGNRLCGGISNASFGIEGQNIKVTASLGIARLTAHDPDTDDFKTSYKLADQAMYSAKARGRNQVGYVN